MGRLSAERVAEHFVNYLFEGYQGNARHVRRVTAWLGLLVLGIEKLSTDWMPSRSRQLVFTIGARRIKVRFNHKIRPKGGIEFVEIIPGPGSPDGAVLRTIASLADAEKFYQSPSFEKSN
jgi:hypothetical protein